MGVKTLTTVLSNKKEVVILIHGIWVGRWAMWPLAYRLRRAGFEVHFFGYPTLTQDLDTSAAQLNSFVNKIDAQTIHYVVHSLGGILLLNMLRLFPTQLFRRIVFLGVPVCGSSLARRLQPRRIGKYILGKSTIGGYLLEGLPCPHDREIGMLMGSVPFGIAILFGRHNTPNDGAVTHVDSTSPDISKYIVVRTSHSGMLLSSKVAQHVVNFLRHGTFTQTQVP